MEWWHYLIVVGIWLVIITLGRMNAVGGDDEDKKGHYRNVILTFIFLLLLLITFKYLFIE